MVRDDFHVNPRSSFAEISAEQYRRWYPDRIERVEGTFEIGLVMAGAVSAGAYTAGVLDYLFETLEQALDTAARDIHNRRFSDG